MASNARLALRAISADLSRDAATATIARGGARPLPPGVHAPLQPPPPRAPNGKFGHLRYDGDDAITSSTLPATQYAARLCPAMSRFARDNTDQAVSDVVVSAAPGSHTLLVVLPWVCFSGFANGQSQLTIPGPYGTAGRTPANVACTCRAAALMARALSPSTPLDDGIRYPVATSACAVPKSVADLDHRRHHTTTAFFRVGCNLAVLLAWLDAYDPEYLMSSRPAERLVTNSTDVLTPSAARLQRAGAPARFAYTVTPSMLASRVAYNDNGGWSAHNHPSVLAGKEKLDSELTKEVHRRSALILLAHAYQFMPCFLPVPLGLVPKGRDGDMRVIADSTFAPRAHNIGVHERHLPRSVNAAISKDSVTTCRYGTTLMHTIYMIVNLRIWYGALPIYFCLLDTAGAFRHARVHYAVLPLLTAWIFHSLFVFIGMSFGAVWSPGEYSIVEELVSNTLGLWSLDSISKNADALAFSEQFRQPDPDTAADLLVPMRPIRGDVFNPGLTVDALSAILARCFVDDFILLCMFTCSNAFHLTLTALLWAKLVWFSHISAPFRPSFVALAKLTPFATKGKALGYWLDTNAMTVQVPDAKLEELRRSIQPWLDGERGKSAEEIQSLLGSVRFAFIVLPTGAFLSVRLNNYLTAMTESSGAKRNHSRAGPRTFPVPDDVRPELEHMMFYLDHAARGYFTCHMERMLLRFPDFDCPSDASGYGCAGWCKQLRIGWYYVWPREVLDFFEASQSINLLEYFGVVMNVWFMHSRLREITTELPCCHFWTDNEAARAWTAAAHLPAPSAAALSRVMDGVVTHTNMHTRSDHVPGVVNGVADGMSRRPPQWLVDDSALSNALSSPRPPIFLPPQLDQILHPPRQLVSVMLQALLSSSSPPVHQLIQLTNEVNFRTSPHG